MEAAEALLHQGLEKSMLRPSKPFLLQRIPILAMNENLAGFVVQKKDPPAPYIVKYGSISSSD